MRKDLKSDTIIAHAGLHPDDNHGIVNPPVYHASTILKSTVEAYERPDNQYQYGREGTPTSTALIEAITALENAHGTVLAPSGKMAINIAIMAFFDQGGHLLITDSAYLPIRRFCGNRLERMGVDVEFYDPNIGSGIADLIRDDTKLIWMESPGSITFEVQDIPAIVAAATARGVPTGIDNTWAAGYYLKPLNLGVDISMQSLTKYVVGHSDALVGSVSCNEQTYHKVKKEFASFGVSVGPDDVYLAQRGLRSMAARLARHQESGYKVARWLESRPEVKRMLHPGLESHPDHALWKRDFTGACGLFGLILNTTNKQAAAAMVNGLELFGIGASWGGFESLVLMQYPEKIRTAKPWTEEGVVIRLHIGLEDPDDLIADLEDGFRRLNDAL